MVEITEVDENDKDVFDIESLIGPSLLTSVDKPPASTTKKIFAAKNSGKKGRGKKSKKSGGDGSDGGSTSGNPALLALYFSASWCPPCQKFTPMLIEFYKKAKEAAPDDFEIVYVSSDRNQEEFDEYYKKMPWLAIPPMEGAAQIKTNLATKLGVNAIPALAIFDGKTGEFIAGGTARDDVIRVTVQGGSLSGQVGECTPTEAKTVLGKWKSMDRHSMAEASMLMDTGSGKQSMIGRILGFIARNPMVIFVLVYGYRYLQQKYGGGGVSKLSDAGGGDEEPPAAADDSEF